MVDDDISECDYERLRDDFTALRSTYQERHGFAYRIGIRGEINDDPNHFDDLNGVVVSNADCYSKDPGFESRVSHGPFQKVKHWIDNPSCKK
jgi:hypothetical protein